jgi:hypothetical protein
MLEYEIALMLEYEIALLGYPEVLYGMCSKRQFMRIRKASEFVIEWTRSEIIFLFDIEVQRP